MIPTTPNGTRTWRSSSPLARVEPRTTSPDRVGQAGDVAEPVGHLRDAALVEPEPVDQRGGGAAALGRGDVLGVRGEHRLGRRGERARRPSRAAPGPSPRGSRRRARGPPRGRATRRRARGRGACDWGHDGERLAGHEAGQRPGRAWPQSVGPGSKRLGDEIEIDPSRRTARDARAPPARPPPDPTTSQNGRLADSRYSFHRRSASEATSTRACRPRPSSEISARSALKRSAAQEGALLGEPLQCAAHDQRLDRRTRHRDRDVPEPRFFDHVYPHLRVASPRRQSSLFAGPPSAELPELA